MDDPTRWCENDASNGNAPYGAPGSQAGAPFFSPLSSPRLTNALASQLKPTRSLLRIHVEVFGISLLGQSYCIVATGNSMKLASLGAW